MKRFIILLVALWAGTAHAHKPSDSLLTLKTQEDVVAGQWDIALRDLDHAIGLDSDGNGAITWGEVRQHHDAIATYAFSRLQLTGAAGACTLSDRDHLIDHHSDGAYAVLRFVADCGPQPTMLTVHYSLLFDLDPQHRGILRSGDSDHVLLFSANLPEQQLVLGPPVMSWHMVDPVQLLFLAALLLPLTRRRATRDPGKIIVAFILGQSLPFALVRLNSIAIPPIIANAGIGLSILAALASQFSPSISRTRWMMAFTFALLRGFAVLTGLNHGAMATTTRYLLGTNLQLALASILVIGAFLFIERGIRQRGSAARDALQESEGATGYGLAALDPPFSSTP